jgi:hypothetical protein
MMLDPIGSRLMGTAERCGFCGQEIRPLDRHAHSISPDKDAAQSGFVLVTCILNRHYKVTPDPQHEGNE